MSSEHPFINCLGRILSEGSTVSSNDNGGNPNANRGKPQLQRAKSKSSVMREGVGSQFRVQLSHLRNRINHTEPHYVLEAIRAL